MPSPSLYVRQRTVLTADARHVRARCCIIWETFVERAMPPVPPIHDEELERRVAERTADLSELLGHLSSRWDDERRQLARKLHDSLGSSMTALSMHLSLLAKQLPPDTPLHERSELMKTLLKAIITTNREMQLSLWNDCLEFLGVKPALNELVEQFGAAHRITVRLSLPDDDVDCPRELAVALLRSVEEGLANVVAHAQASDVDVVLDDDGEQLMLTVRDNGIGPGIADMAPLRCHGLRALRERAVYLGGSMTLLPAPEGGSMLTVILPLPRAA
jgi:signal transduction histidine kinase